ncbi:hypothetical protein [Acinetobacter sp. ANC 4173]|uniref:ABZJ_00068 family colistin stress protein n=1 Tax=Acinetobacter sp. ANC 4173 TaxID=2529837 RepID=UPI0013F14A73|nr:hypothetical protein [Acinetobacter sp. ANC 4173]
MAQFFILFCAAVTFALMACDPRPAELMQTASAWDQAPHPAQQAQQNAKDQSVS